MSNSSPAIAPPSSHDELLHRAARLPIASRSLNAIQWHERQRNVAPETSRNYDLQSDGGRWPNATIPYTIMANFSERSSLLIIQAMYHIMSRSCVKFVPAAPTDTGYLKIVNGLNGSGCYCNVGYGGGVATCNLDPICFGFYQVVHELLHSCGAHHEHARPDRDAFIKVNWTNMDPMKVNAMYRYSSPGNILPECPPMPVPAGTNLDACGMQGLVDTFNLPYDYESIMHYGFTSFTTNEFNVMNPTMPNIAQLGNYRGMTPLDALKLQAAYSCPMSSCFQNQNGTSGTLDGTTTANSVCEWAITVPYGSLVKITFTSFSFTGCNDFVSLLDDAANVTMATFCSTNPAPTTVSYITTTDSLRVTTQRTNTANVFQATWVAYKPKCCNKFTLSSSTLSQYSDWLGQYQMSTTDPLVVGIWPVYRMLGIPTNWIAHVGEDFERDDVQAKYPWVIGQDGRYAVGQLGNIGLSFGPDVLCPDMLTQDYFKDALDPTAPTITCNDANWKSIPIGGPTATGSSMCTSCSV